MVNEIIPASSARFSCNDIRSRNRSPPVQLSGQDTRGFHIVTTVTKSARHACGPDCLSSDGRDPDRRPELGRTGNSMEQKITWQAMTPKQTWWHAAYSSAVAGTILGLARLIEASPQRRHPA